MGLFSDAKTVSSKAKTKTKTIGGKVQVKCANKNCRKTFMARQADVARGWGKFCSKSCKAIRQEQRTGQYGQYLQGKHSREGSNRWINDDGDRCARVWTNWGKSVVSTEDKMTGEVTIEEFDKHGVSQGVRVGPGYDDW